MYLKLNPNTQEEQRQHLDALENLGYTIIPRYRAKGKWPFTANEIVGWRIQRPIKEWEKTGKEY